MCVFCFQSDRWNYLVAKAGQTHGQLRFRFRFRFGIAVFLCCCCSTVCVPLCLQYMSLSRPFACNLDTCVFGSKHEYSTSSELIILIILDKSTVLKKITLTIIFYIICKKDYIFVNIFLKKNKNNL